MNLLSDKEENKFLTHFIVESDAIEGIKADPKLVGSQLEQHHADGHVGALLLVDSIAKDKKALTQGTIQLIQGLITAEQYTKPGGDKLRPEYVGKYRLVGVQVGGRICPSPIEVPTLMERWLSQVNEWQKKVDSLTKRLDQIATFHWDFEFIHPFADGNGRSGRAVVYYLMRYSGLNPFIFTSEDRFRTYYPAFRSPEDMQSYFEKKSKGY